MRTCSNVFLAIVFAVAATEFPDARQSGDPWTRDFSLVPDELSSRGSNPYFILEPGHVLVLEDGRERLVISVLAETRLVNGVETRVVEERETDRGQPVEVSRNFYAISTRTNSVFYFGEEVDIYKGGKIASHDGAWLAGVNGARPGLMMPGVPLLRARYYQEMAPGVAMDRAEIVSLTDALKTPAGAFTNVLRTLETTPLEPARQQILCARHRPDSRRLVSPGQTRIRCRGSTAPLAFQNWIRARFATGSQTIRSSYRIHDNYARTRPT